MYQIISPVGSTEGLLLLFNAGREIRQLLLWQSGVAMSAYQGSCFIGLLVMKQECSMVVVLPFSSLEEDT